MPDSIISALPPASPVTPADLIPGVQGGVTKVFTAQQLLAAANAASLQVADYAALRSVTANIMSVYVTGYLASASPSGIAGLFIRDDTDTTSADNGGTIITASNGKRWKRQFNGPVYPQWFGAKGNGVNDDASIIQKALDTGKDVFLPNGIYYNGVGVPLYIRTTGQRLIGESNQNVYLTSSASSNHDLLRISSSLADVSGVLFRPGSVNNICVRIYAAWCYLHDNRFLAASPGSGTAVVLTDQDPDTGGTVAGAYTHRLEGNHFGAAGYAFARDIDDYSVNGITATKFSQNQHICDNPIRLVKGGGNLYTGNLFQSYTGTSGSKVGNCLDLGANVISETIHGNYFELYSYAVVARNASNAYQSFRATQNHYDNIANTYFSSNTNFYQDDGIILTELKNGWSDNYSGSSKRIFNGPTGGATTILSLDDANKAIQVNKVYSSIPNLSYTADNQTQIPASKVAIITGAGAVRTGGILGTTGVQDGQELTLLGITWSVTLTNTNIRFASNAASVIFGNVAGQVQAMQLVFRAATSTWYEVSRVLY